MELCLATELLMRPLLDLAQIIAGIRDQLAQCYSLGRMEGESRHRLEA